MTWVLRPKKLIVPEPEIVIPDPLVQFPYKAKPETLVAMVIALVRPDISTVPVYGMAVSSVIVPVTDPAFVNVAVS